MKLSWLAPALVLLGAAAGVRADLDTIVYLAFCGKPFHRSPGVS